MRLIPAVLLANLSFIYSDLGADDNTLYGKTPKITRPIYKPYIPSTHKKHKKKIKTITPPTPPNPYP